MSRRTVEVVERAPARVESRDFKDREPPIDREKTCPLLLRVFVKEGTHHSEAQFVDATTVPVDDEIMIYTWPDATLRELVTLIKEVNDSARRPGVRLSMAFVYPDPRGGGYRMRDAGTVHSTKAGRDDDRTLRSLRFQTGDFLDVAVQ